MIVSVEGKDARQVLNELAIALIEAGVNAGVTFIAAVSVLGINGGEQEAIRLAALFGGLAFVRSMKELDYVQIPAIGGLDGSGKTKKRKGSEHLKRMFLDVGRFV